MPKKTKPTSRQPSLLPRIPVPQMPEGYYSSGPNPNLRRFVQEHATPFNPAGDKYKTEAFKKQITIIKRKSPAMDLHIYWSKKPHDAIREYIRHYTQPGDLVLDSFCGSGGTALAALMEGRAAVAIDLSPAATFITKNYCTPVDVDELQRAFEELQRQVKPEMEWLYETRCDRCDGRATTAYTVYSYAFQCPRCLEKTPLFDCPEVAGEKGKPIKVCPSCLARGIQEEIHTRLPRFEPAPVLVSYLCEEGCKPQRGERRHNDPHEKKREYFEKYDLAKIREIEGKPIPYWYPPHRMMNVESDTEPWGDEWRPGRNFRTVAELFTKRNLWALASLKAHIMKYPFKDFLLFTLNTALLTLSKMCRHDWPSVMAGTYYIPQINRELNVWNNFSERLPRKIEGIEEISKALLTNSLFISTQSATDLAEIPANSLDYIFTDPPYGGNIQYGELNFIWESWLDVSTNWHDGEIVINTTRHKSDLDWHILMKRAMQEGYRVLKPGRWISVCYHDTSEGTWQLLQDIMTEVGFIPERSEETLFIDTGQKSYNQLTAEKVTKRDLVINFRKPRLDEISGQAGLFDAADPSSFQEAARAVLSEALTARPGSPADRLYDELVSRLVRKGQFERHDFDALLRSVAEEVNGRWYLLSTADILDEAESSKEEAAARRLEVYMAQALTLTPNPSPSGRGEAGEEGVHYSDLFEQYLPVKDKPRRLLQDWLPEFFFKTSEGTWRPPQDEDERRQKAALRSSGALRRIKRFANALIEGIPPYEKDQPENPVTLADWIRQCRRAGLYEVGRALYEKGGMRFDGLDEVTQLEVEEDYQVCVGRSGAKPEKKVKRSEQEENFRAGLDPQNRLFGYD